jgi:hypothetical protein
MGVYISKRDGSEVTAKGGQWPLIRLDRWVDKFEKSVASMNVYCLCTVLGLSVSMYLYFGPI